MRGQTGSNTTAAAAMTASYRAETSLTVIAAASVISAEVGGHHETIVRIVDDAPFRQQRRGAIVIGT